jgi:pSer/pThr/pTyr-binding forkhead associated (FHA) protein
MATLILEHDGHRKAAVLQGRVVIGRRANSHIMIPDRSVSRIHAWIGKNEDRYFIADSGSRVGTQINGHHLQGRKQLEDGDEIKIGPAVIKFQSNGTPPTDVEPLDLSDRPIESNDGIFLDCACGAPLWAPWDFGGKIGQCRYCGQMVEMPEAEGHAPPDPSNDTFAPGMPPPPPSALTRGIRITSAGPTERKVRHSIFDAPIKPPPSSVTEARTQTEVLCGACQSQISLLEETFKCPDCGVTFHAECWVENRGCSSYGCKQVGILDPHRDEPKAPPAPVVAGTLEERGADGQAATEARATAIEWDYLFLPISLMAALLGVLSFGIPPLIAALSIMLYRFRGRRVAHPRLLAAALLLSLLAVVAGIGVSWYWWLVVPSAESAVDGLAIL